MTAMTALIGIGIAIGLVLSMFIVLGVGYAILAGGEPDADSRGFNFVASLLQDGALVAAAVMAARMALGQVVPATFGFRSFKFSALGWVLLALFGFFALAIVYGQIVDVPDDADKVEDQLGLPLTALFAILIAPPIEELFFRGFLYRCFSNSWGIAAGAIVSGLIFGVVHAGSAAVEALPLLAALGVILALLYEKTGSLWPSIILHIAYNTIAVIALSAT